MAARYMIPRWDGKNGKVLAAMNGKRVGDVGCADPQRHPLIFAMGT